MSKLLVCQHVPFEILGTLDPLFRDSGFRIRYVNFGRQPDARPCLDGYDGLVVLGGPMNVDDVDRYPHLDTETALIRDAIERGLPVLGICLGAQLVARALGAAVYPNGAKEIGWYDVSPTADARDDPLMAHFAPTERIFQWHGDTFDIPDDAVHLACSPSCAHQAFRYRDNVYALQFHLEVDEAMILRWLRVPGNVEEISALDGAIDPQRIRAETPRSIGHLTDLSRRTFGEFVKMFCLPPKRRALPSR